MAKNVTTAEFQALIDGTEMPVVLDFWAAWCGPCRAFASVVDRLHEEYEGKAVIGKVNVDEEPSLAQKFGVMSIPTVLIFKNGQLVDTQIGSSTFDTMADKIDKYLG